ncbi:MAG TPA: hypothetical protein VJ044_15730 [Candidatus Hodarchaeales archaeon]|nr:hypothetical protein [Candidatus Hodarchaeales archaeon]
MGKEEITLLNEITEKLSAIQNQLNFMQVQLGSSKGGSSPSSDRPDLGKSSSDSKQLQNLDKKFEEILEQTTKNSESISSISEQVNKLTSEKVVQADERMQQVTSLLEKGLALTEMGATLVEIKDRMEEVLVELGSAAKSVEGSKTG